MAKTKRNEDADRRRKKIVSDLLNLYLEDGNLNEAYSLTGGKFSKGDAWKAIRGALKRLDFNLIIRIKEITQVYPCKRTMSRLVGKIIKQADNLKIRHLIALQLVKEKRRINSLVNWVTKEDSFAIKKWLDMKPSISALDKFIQLVTKEAKETRRLYLEKSILFEVVKKASKKGKQNFVRFCLNSSLSSSIMDLNDFKEALTISDRKIKKAELKKIVLHCAAGKNPYINFFEIAKKFKIPKDLVNLFFREGGKSDQFFSFKEFLSSRISKKYLREMRKKFIDKGDASELKDTIKTLGPLSNDESELLIKNCLKTGDCLNAYNLEKLLPLIKRSLTKKEGNQFVKSAIKENGKVSDGMKVARLLRRELSNYELKLVKTEYEK